MLGEGLKQLKDNKIIDDRLYDWSQQLQAFRNLAAHPEDITISREDVEDLQTFVYAIVEYIYDLADRYKDFKERVEVRANRKRTQPNQLQNTNKPFSIQGNCNARRFYFIRHRGQRLRN